MSFRCRAVAFLVGTTWLRVSRRESLVISSRKTVPMFGIRILAAVFNNAYFTPTSIWHIWQREGRRSRAENFAPASLSRATGPPHSTDRRLGVFCRWLVRETGTSLGCVKMCSYFDFGGPLTLPHLQIIEY